MEFKCALEKASLNNGDLDEDNLLWLHNPITSIININDRDLLLSIKLFLSTSNASDQTYKNIYKDLLDDSPDRKILSHAQAKKKLAELTGVHAIVYDMCLNSCITYTGPFSSLEQCPMCEVSAMTLTNQKSIHTNTSIPFPLACSSKPSGKLHTVKDCQG